NQEMRDNDSTREQQRGPSVDAILGIDFGTRFTKVALCLPHIDRRQVLSFGPRRQQLLQSRILIGEDGRLSAVNSDPNSKTQLIVEYLKIRLAGQNGGAFGTSLSIGDVPLSHAIRALCAQYLAEIFKMAKGAARVAFPSELAPGRAIKWFANVGVPVKHYDSE